MVLDGSGDLHGLLSRSLARPTLKINTSAYVPYLTAEPFDHCIPNPCKNGGTCIKDGYSFHCICPVDYLLPDCENSK